MKSKYGLVCAAACALAASSWSSAARADSAPKESEKAEHPDRPVKIGALGGVGFPRPLAVEGVLEIERLFLLGAEYSALPTTTISGAQTSMWGLAADARVFPLRNGFFVGVRVGKQHLDESASLTIVGVGTYSGSQTADTTFINPRMGFLWSFGPIALGIDAGVQIPLSTSTTSSMPPGVTPPQVVTDVTHTLSAQALPTIDLLRLGIVM